MNRMLLLMQLDRVAWRYRQLRLWQLLALVWLAAAAFGVAFWALKPASANPLPLLCFTVVAGALSAIYFAIRSVRDHAWVAQKIEAAYPELRTCLLAAVELQPELPNGRFGYLQGRVIHQALSHARAHRWTNIISAAQLWLTALVNVLCFAFFVTTVVLLAMNIPLGSVQGSPVLPAELPSDEWTMTVEPGNTEVELGTSLLILARIQGPLPNEAALLVRSDDGVETTLPMSASLNDPVFAGRIPLVDQPLSYYVYLGGQNSPTYRVTVFEYPRLERADAKLNYPDYTGLADRTVQDVRTVSVVEGTELTLQCFLNKPVGSARLLDTKDSTADPILLTAASDDPLRYESTWICQQSRRLKLELIDDAGRQNQKGVQFNINVLPNQPPKLKVVFPAKDLEVSPLEEVDLKANVWDDFGTTKFGLTYSIAGAEPVDVQIAEQTAAKEKFEATHQLRLEDLAAEPDQLLSYHWWAEDLGPDGQPRRVFSDMYFAEVRPFEEIFRQGEHPPGGEQQQRQQQQQNQQGQGQNAQDAQQLAKLQKDIINATWNLLRREVAAPLSAAFSSDAEQIQLSQEAALEQAASLAENVQDQQSVQHVEAVLQHMQAAAESLQSAAQTPDRESLRPALASAQQAYQSLLRLRAREHEVVRQQQQQQQGQPSSQQQQSARSQQQQEQLQQLDLQNEENRYETERTAQERQQESAEERENRQVQNRLRELARRQNDVNDRVKELQSALEEAQTAEQQEEIRRQLKRLQDEQRQILQDTDELQSRLEQPENAERMTEERQQLEETRDQVRRASEALEQERVSQAAAAGTRAEQQFEDLREEFRRRAANRFNEEMQEMRQEARQLEEREQKIAEQLQQPEAPTETKPSLQDDAGAEREQLAEQLGEQRQRLEQMQERMRSTIGEAEEVEPILSQRLYDAVRNLQDSRVDQALQQAERAVRQGLPQQAQQQEQAAGEGVRQLREAVERAAEGVLGDGTEALRRAREELQDLSRDLNEEIRRETGEPRPPSEQEQNAEPRTGEPPQPGRGQPREGESSRGQPGERNGEQQPMRPGEQGEGEPGQGEPGQGAQGEPQSGEPREGQSPGQPGQRQPGQAQRGTGEGQPPGEPSNEPQNGEPQAGEPQSGERQPGQRGDRERREPGQGPEQPGNQPGGNTAGGGNVRRSAPLTGEEFREWSDRLRDVEEMVDDPDLRAEAARIRERARAIRAEHKRHSEEPNWDLVQQQVAGPLVELQQRVSEELLRRTSKKAIVPLDRDPVPPQYSEKTRQYYERLGTGKQ